LRGRTGAAVLWMAGLAAIALPGRAAGQDLADFDYENLSFRGFGFEVGYMFPTRVDNTESYKVTVDLGYLGPGVRLVPSFTWWSSDFSRSEVRELEDRVAGLVSRETGAPPPTTDAASTARPGRTGPTIPCVGAPWSSPRRVSGASESPTGSCPSYS